MAFFKNKTGYDTQISRDFEITINGVQIKVALKVDQEEILESKNRSNDQESCARDPNSGELKMKVDGFLMKYGASIPKNVFNDMQAALLDGYNNFLVLRSDFQKMVEDNAAYLEFKEKLTKTAENNNKGKELEKLGEIEGALSIYEKNLDLGYHATHSYDRLIILYRKLKMFNDELRIIDLYINMIMERNSKRRHSMIANNIDRSSSPEIIRLKKRRETVIIKIEDLTN